MKLQEDVVHAIDKEWHSACFTCLECDLPFLSDEGDAAQFYVYEKQPYW